MSYLLYCIFRQALPGTLKVPDGIGGDRVFTTNYNGLSAALSKLANWTPDSPSLPAYEAVVESFYRHQTVIPMRYGHRVESPWDAVVLLRQNHAAYRALLCQLGGLAEVGLHVLQNDSMLGADRNQHASGAKPFPSRSSLPGAASVNANRPHHWGPQGATTLQQVWAEKLCDSLRGSFVRHKVEFPSPRKGRLLSLYFLVPRSSAEAFRQAARDLPADRSVTLLLGGACPPYDFVDALQT